MKKITKLYKVSDSFQQMIGAFLLAGPFVVTEEVWKIAEGMMVFQTIILVTLNLAIGYSALYYADKSRNADVEQEILGIPYRFISLILVAFLAVTLLALIIGANTTFGASPMTFVNAMAISSTFAIIGAATADSIF